MGRMNSSSFRMLAADTAMASWPMPENHLLMRPCRSRLSIFFLDHARLEQSLVERKQQRIVVIAAVKRDGLGCG